MSTKKKSNVHSEQLTHRRFPHVDRWLISSDNETVQYDSKLNDEIHLAIIEEPLEYPTPICDLLFTLYHNVQHRPFVLQFLPSFVTSYYNVLYHYRHSDSVNGKTKDVCSTIDTFLVSLYNLSLTDETQRKISQGFRVPNLTFPSVYHTPNSDNYAPIPLTQNAISKHDNERETIHLQRFTPFDSVNAAKREQILWFLLMQYGTNVCFMDKYSRKSFIQMSNKLCGQGFAFNTTQQIKTNSILPPTGRRIRISSRIMSEILGILLYFKSNSSDNDANESMRLLKQRAEYELYADVILMTESLGFLHEFEHQRPEKQDAMGIEIELPPTADVVRQKRTATTRRSIQHRQRSSKHNDGTVLNETNINENINSPSPSLQQRIKITLNDENSPMNEYKISNDNSNDLESSLIIDEPRTNISSSIGLATSTPSPSSTRHYKPVSLTSTEIHRNKDKKQNGLSPILQIKTTAHNGDQQKNKKSITSLVQPHSSHRGHEEKEKIVTTLRFPNDTSDESEIAVEETYL